jgi:hypothetical protein
MRGFRSPDAHPFSSSGEGWQRIINRTFVRPNTKGYHPFRKAVLLRLRLGLFLSRSVEPQHRAERHVPPVGQPGVAGHCRLSHAEHRRNLQRGGAGPTGPHAAGSTQSMKDQAGSFQGRKLGIGVALVVPMPGQVLARVRRSVGLQDQEERRTTFPGRHCVGELGRERHPQPPTCLPLDDVHARAAVLLLDVRPAHPHDVGTALSGVHGERHDAGEIWAGMALRDLHVLEAPGLMPAVCRNRVGPGHDRVRQEVAHERPLLHSRECSTGDLLAPRCGRQPIKKRLHERRSDHMHA